MIIAIDESGSFAEGAETRHFFAAVHLRQRRTLYKLKESQFLDWESSLPRSLKNAKGEIKGSALSDDELVEFAYGIMCADPYLGVTPFSIRPADNPKSIVDKHRAIQLVGIREGAREYLLESKPDMASRYQEFGNWFKNLSYVQYLKIVVLGECVTAAMVNAIGHSITGHYDEELTRMRFQIDRDFIKEPRHNWFWHEVLRNQLYNSSKSNPIPLLKKWKRKGHPFLEKYARNGRLDFNELFWKQCEFVTSHDHFEIRIADIVSTIVSRFFNRRRCTQAYSLVRKCFLADGKMRQLVLNDFDMNEYRHDPNDNPWRITK
jgi:hypothetical protein